MFTTTDDRPTRKLKKENRFYSFLNRSRSRSRPQPAPSAPNPPHPGSKPPHRIPSRPLSATITPPNQQSISKRKINLFGISFRRPSKSRSRSRSRPGTPRLSLDIPPLPTVGFEEAAPTASRSASPFPQNHPSHEKHPSLNTDGASKLKGLFSGSSRSNTPIPVVSGPVKRKPSQKQNLKPPDSLPPPSNVSAIPKIIHTPATPVRGAPTTTSTKPSTSRPTGHSFKNRSLDTGYRYRATMDAVNEEVRLSKEIQMEKLARSSKGKGKEKEKEVDPVPRSGLTKMTTSARSTKHGSFDFERPGWGAVAIQRTGSNGTSISGWSKSGNGEVVFRESTLGPGLAGVGTIQRDTSMKRAKEREEKSKELERQVKDTLSTKSKPTKAPSTNFAPSTNGHHTPPSGNSSSLGKASGKRLIGVPNGASSRGHGLFSFEPPVPSPTWSTNTASTTKEVSASWGGQSEKERERIKRERERQQDKKSQRQRDRSPVPVPSLNINTNTAHRSGSKGRSLDLNLGLAWAPSKVKESALLPSSKLFKRTPSNSSSVKSTVSRSVNSSAHGHGHGGRSQESYMQAQDFTSEERSRVGREVADMFRIALGEVRYSRFKTYIHQFDAHEIPFDGPTGIIAKVDGLLLMIPSLPFEEKRQLMDKLVRIILQTA